jgi:hypothetical protein
MILVTIIVGKDQRVAVWMSSCYFPNCLLDEYALDCRASASFDHPKGFACPSKNNSKLTIFKFSYCFFHYQNKKLTESW